MNLVDTYDIFINKLFSTRTKDRDDVRMLAHRLDRAIIQSRLQETASSLLADPKLADSAAKDWYIVY